MLDKLTAIEDKFHILEEQLSDPEIISDLSRFKKINKEYKDLQEIILSFREYKQILSGIEMAQEMIADSDPEMQEMGSNPSTMMRGLRMMSSSQCVNIYSFDVAFSPRYASSASMSTIRG